MHEFPTHTTISGRHLPAYVFGRPRARWIAALNGTLIGRTATRPRR